MADWSQCTQCGLKHALRPDGRCPRCGQPVMVAGGAGGGAWAPPGSYGMPGGYAPPVPKYPNYLVQAILVTICCCLPGGIVAIVYSSQVNSKIARGDAAGAASASSAAKTWCWASFWVGLLLNVAYAMVKTMGRNYR